ncbi:MAG: hypothetical protein ACR2FY_24670 [Pirellulaceae bacterium]
MKPILWSILAIFVGVVVGGIVVGVVEIPGYLLHPPPPGLTMDDMDAIKAHAAKTPLAAHVGVAIAWGLGPLAGSLVACLIARHKYWMHGAIIAAIFILLDVSNYWIPSPLWLMVAGVVLPPVTATLGAALAQQVLPPRANSPQPSDMREKDMAC